MTKITRLRVAAVAALVLAPITALTAVGFVDVPAAVAGNGCGWTSQALMENATGTCRSGFVFDPGSGQSMTRDELLSYASLYENNGFSPNFLWYAPQTQLTLSPTDNNALQWTDCAPNGVEILDSGAGVTPCPSSGDITLDPTKYIDDYDFNGAAVQLDTWTWAGTSIFLACGNYTPTIAPPPVPSITGSKLSDLNSTPVPNWPITLTLLSSDVGQTPGPVGSTFTDATGNFSFPLNRLGPGTYQVAEGSESGWYPQHGTPTSYTVTVGFGVGDTAFSVPAFVNHLNLPPVAVIKPIPPTDQTSISGATVTLDGSASNDQDSYPTGTIASYTWTVPAPGYGTFTTSTPTTNVTLLPGTYQVTLTVNDGALDSAPVSTSVTVYPNITEIPESLSGTEGSSLSGIWATFQDPDPNGTAGEYTATIDWGDGTTPSQNVPIVQDPAGGFDVTGSHVYVEEGNYTAQVTVSDIDNGFNTAMMPDQVGIGDAQLVATGRTAAVCSVGTSLSDYPVATFTDANPFATTNDFSATIDWGDSSTSPGVVSGPTGGPFTVEGSHDHQALGFKTISVHIVDDGGSTADVANPPDTILLYACPGPGSFVVGDLSVGPVAVGQVANGAHVTFWGAQWWKLNSLSGGPAPAAFKGFADAVSYTAAKWTARPGNSSAPPATAPSYMAVIVTSDADKSGSTNRGNIVNIVIVQTDPGYMADPGHAGTGTVVWDLGPPSALAHNAKYRLRR